MIELAHTLDRSRIPPHVATELGCHLELRASAELAAASDGRATTTSVCLVFDCSGSMAGAKAEAAIEAAHRIVDTIDDRHRISLVGFATSHWVLVDNASPAETGREPIKRQIERLRGQIRGGTNLSEGIRRGIQVVRRRSADATVIAILSDGEADSPDDAVRAGLEASHAGIQVFAVGIGDEFRADDLLRVVRPSNGAVLGERDAAQLASAFGVLLGRIESFVATNVRLVVALEPGVHPGAVYKTAPERAFVGNHYPGDREIRLHVGNLERGQTYSFLIALTPPSRAGGELAIARAAVRYDVPALRLIDQRAELAIAIAYDAAAAPAPAPDNAVAQVQRRAKLAELVDELADSERKLNMARSVRLLEELLRRSEEQGDTRMLEELRGLAPPIAQSRLNALVLAATGRASPALPPPPPPAAPAPLELYNVMLVDPGGSVIELMREIRELTGLGLAEVHELIKTAPSTIAALPDRDAAALAQRLEAAGARIAVEPKR